MAHHSTDGPLGQGRSNLMKKLAIQAQNQFLPNMTPGTEATKDLLKRLGATGDYPEGQFSPNDEGALRFAVGAENGKVLMDFGTPVHCIGMTPEQARSIAASLLNFAREASRQERGSRR